MYKTAASRLRSLKVSPSNPSPSLLLEIEVLAARSDFNSSGFSFDASLSLYLLLDMVLFSRASFCCFSNN